jgi:cell division protein FtsN
MFMRRAYFLQRGSTFVGILIGLVLGLSIALAVAWYINKLPNPFSKAPQAPPPPKAGVAPPKQAEAPKPAESTPPAEKPKADPASPAPESKDQDKKSSALQDTFFLQAGAFQSATDADNMKGRLALMGLEASVQARDLGDKGVWHRVRVGPYRDVEELNRVRGVLKQNGIDAALVKVRESEK